MKLKQTQRHALGSALFNLGIAIAGAMVLGQFIGQGPIHVWTFLFGLVLFVGTFIVATKLSK